MTKKWTRGAVVLAALTLAACDAAAPRLETRTFPLAHLSTPEAADLIDPYIYGDREGAPGALSGTDGAITVRETADNLDQIERVLAEFDVPRPDIRLLFQLIEADGFTGSDPAIADVEEELRRLFRFQGYRLAGEATVIASDFTPVLQTIQTETQTYQLRADVMRVGSDATQLNHVILEGRGVELRTSVTVRPGQTLVIGSAPLSGTTTTLFLTVRVLGSGGSD